MQQETAKALQTKELQDAWRALGAEAGGQPPEDFGKLVNAEVTKWAKVVKDSGAKID
jgi:tripartite-type tricarboxylate transporter receptor subunit TctC